VTDKAPEKDRDWDKEMREVDRLLSKLPYAEPGAGQRGGGGEATLRRPVAAVGAPSGPPSWVATWARVGLGLAIGIGMTQWPYTHGCGLRLGAYLVGVAAVLAAGVWSSISSWKGRLGLAHILSELLIIWGLVLGAREVLPRVGYAKTAASWLCP
jgi:hypothetical protein